MQTKDKFKKQRFDDNRLVYKELEQCDKASMLSPGGDNGTNLLFLSLNRLRMIIDKVLLEYDFIILK